MLLLLWLAATIVLSTAASSKPSLLTHWKSSVGACGFQRLWWDIDCWMNCSHFVTIPSELCKTHSTEGLATALPTTHSS